MYWVAILVCTSTTLSVRHSNLIPLIPRRQLNLRTYTSLPWRLRILLSYEEGASGSVKRGQGPNVFRVVFTPRDLEVAATGRTGEAPAHNQLYVILAISLVFARRQLGWGVFAAKVTATLGGVVHVAKAKPEAILRL